MAGNVLERLVLLLESGADSAEDEAAIADAVEAFKQKLMEIEEAVQQGGDLPGALARYLASAFSALPAPSVWQAAMLSQAAGALAGKSPVHKDGAAETTATTTAGATERETISRSSESTSATASLPGKSRGESVTPGERLVVRDAGCFVLPPRPGSETNAAQKTAGLAPPGGSPGIPKDFSLPGPHPPTREAGKGTEDRTGQDRIPESPSPETPDSTRQDKAAQGGDVLASLCRAFLEIAAANILVPASGDAVDGVSREQGTLAARLSAQAGETTPEAGDVPRAPSHGIFGSSGKEGLSAENPARSGSAGSGGPDGSGGWDDSGVAATFLLSGRLPPEMAANLATAQKVVELTRTPLAASFVKSVAGRTENKSVTTNVSEVIVKAPGAEPEPDTLFTRSLTDEIESLVAEFDDGIWA